MTHCILQLSIAFLSAGLLFSDCSGWISRPGTQKPEFLNANLWTIRLIALDIDWSWNIFTLHNFYSMLIELLIWAELIYLENVRTENLKFRTDLQDLVMDGWSVTQLKIVYKGRLLKKSSNQKLKLVLPTLVTTTTGYMAFQHCISCDQLGCKLWWWSILNHARQGQTLFPSICPPPCEVAVLLDSNLSRSDALSPDRSSI